MSKRVLITGGAGFVGANIIRYILSKYPDYRVINFDALTASASLNRLSSEENNPLYTLVEGDITEEKDVQYVFEQYKPDYVVHLATQSYIDKDIHQPGIFIKTNVIGTQLLLLNVRDMPGTKMLHLSTSKVYGSFSETVELNEKSPLQPYGPFAASKAAADMFVMASYRSHKINVNIIRPTNVYGDYQYPEKLIPTVIENLLKAKKIPLFGNGEAYRDWVYITDFCKAIDLVLHKGEAGKIYNVSWGENVKNIDIVKRIKKKIGVEGAPIEHLKERLGDESYPTINSNLIREELGWLPELDLDKGLDETIKWYKSHSDWVEEMYAENRGINILQRLR